MARYIDADELLKAMEFVTNDTTCPLHIAAEIDQTISLSQTADVVEVKLGKWIAHYNGSLKPIYRCSVCNERLIGYSDPSKVPYCHCGAKMDGGNGK